MSRTRCLAGSLLAAVFILVGDGAHAQGRGPSVWQLEGKGQTIERQAPDRRTFPAAIHGPAGLVPHRPEVLDESARATRLAEKAQWLGHLVGRFRIGGRVEKRGIVEGIPVTLGGDVKGVADCAAVGAGPGVHCLFNATWPVIEPIRPGVAFTGVPEASEQVMIFRPSVVLLGLNPDTAEIRASMVTDDSVAHTWAGSLDTHTLTARRLTSCFVSQGVATGTPPPCFQPLEIIAEPDSGIVTMVHRAVGVTVRLVLELDPAASAEKPMKSRRVR